MTIRGITDTGLVRRENQDAYRIVEETASGHALCVVCDGMGGPAGGRMASGIAVETYVREMEARLRPELKTREILNASAGAAAAANRSIRAAAAENDLYSGMGTTLVSAVVRDGKAVITNVGDSRAYYLTRTGIFLMTRDHSVVQEMVERGDLTPEEARRHPSRNLITRALGPYETVLCDGFACCMEPDSWLLLCTDGLVNTAADREMLSVVLREPDEEAALRALLSLALERGAPDNVTAVLMRNA